MPDTVLEPPPHTVPAFFTRALLDWLPWLEPLAVEALTERHMAGLVDAARVKSPYFRLLARDPDALRARTLTDKDIFRNRLRWSTALPRVRLNRRDHSYLVVHGCIAPVSPTPPSTRRQPARSRLGNLPERNGSPPPSSRSALATRGRG